jgi:hypothetical protein
MPSRPTVFSGKNCVLLCLVASLVACSANGRRPAAVQRPVPEYVAMTRAGAIFEKGRLAALSGDFECAREYFREAVEVLRPATGPAPTDPELIYFSTQLYESAPRP